MLLVVFHEYLVHAHQVAELSFAELRKFAGSRQKFVSVGVLTDPEVLEVLKVLKQDLADEESRDDAQPEMIRLCELRKLKYLLLEGAGIRPDSSHGLTLGDLHLFGPGRDLCMFERPANTARPKPRHPSDSSKASFGMTIEIGLLNILSAKKRSCQGPTGGSSHCSPRKLG